MTVIRKYPNRRLYNTSSRRYVNLEDVAALIRQGEEVKVVDARTGDDLTRAVLTQIIVEDAREEPAGLPLELLRQLIVATDQAGRDVVMRSLHSAFDAYRNVQEKLSDVGSAAMAPLQLVKNLLVPQPSAAEAEVEYLRRRVAELEARLAAGTSPPNGTRPSRGRRARNT